MLDNGLLKALETPQPGLRPELSALKRDFIADVSRAADDHERLVLSKLLKDVVENIERQPNQPLPAWGARVLGRLRQAMSNCMVAGGRLLRLSSGYWPHWRLLIDDIHPGVTRARRDPIERNRQGVSITD